MRLRYKCNRRLSKTVRFPPFPQVSAGEMVLLGRIELPTSALPRMRSTTELQQHTISRVPQSSARRLRAGRRYWLRHPPLSTGESRSDIGIRPVSPLASRREERQGFPMNDKPAPTREERLALKLRDNLRRRKAQAQALAGALGTAQGHNAPDDSPETLPKPPPGR